MEIIDIKNQLINQYIKQFPVETAQTLNTFTTEEILRYLEQQPIAIQAELLKNMSANVVADIIEALPDSQFSELFSTLDPYSAAKLLSRTSTAFCNQKLKDFPERRSNAISEAMSYPPDAAGFLMDTRIVTFHPQDTVDDVLTKLRTIGNRQVVNAYITDAEGHLLGKVYIQKIAVSSPETTMEEILVPSDRIEVMAPVEEAVDTFERGKIINLPVVDYNNYLLGIIRSETLISETQKDATDDVMTMFGAGREERALSSPWFAIRKRLPWLQINLATAFLAASIVGIFEDVIAQVTVLAVFLPVVAGQSGNTGSQALAVTIRGLALREIQASQWWKISRKEVMVGFINGIAVALTTSVISYFWASSFGIALVIGTSMVLSMVIAGFSGAVIPIILKSFGQDPAQSSSIILTTVTDVMGFLSFLGLAQLLGSALGIF